MKDEAQPRSDREQYCRVWWMFSDTCILDAVRHVPAAKYPR